MRMHLRGCAYTIRKNTFRTNVEGNGTAWVAVLGTDGGYDDDLHQISPVIVALRGKHCVATEKASPKCTGSAAIRATKILARRKINNFATKRAISHRDATNQERDR